MDTKLSTIKITVNGESRAVVIPMTYDKDTDSLSIKELQIEPIPDSKEDISKDIVLQITQMIMNSFSTINQ